LSIQAVALLPFTGDLPTLDTDENSTEGATTGEQNWRHVVGPGGGTGLWRPLNDGALVVLPVGFQAPDADVYEAAKQWLGGKTPSRIWVFPDTVVPELNSKAGIRSVTRQIGRWVRAGRRSRSFLEDLGFTHDEATRLQRDMMSGDPVRLKAASDTLEKRISGKDPKEFDDLLAAFLRRR
jgi:hypothetical protein